MPQSPNDFVCAPILLIAFIRPDLLHDQINRLRPIRPSRLFVAIDGPRSDHPADDALCAACRDATREIDWPCSVQVLTQPANLGIVKAIPTALRWFFSHVEGGIILEDDCIFQPAFLRFASELLVQYANCPEVGAISGNNFYKTQTDQSAAYHFSRELGIWGWAAWRRTIENFNEDIHSYKQDFEHICRENLLCYQGRLRLRRMMEQQLRHSTTWDLQLQLSFFRRKLLVIRPVENLSGNVGCGLGEKATNTGGYCYDQYLFSRVSSVMRPLVAPATLARDLASDRKTQQRTFGILPRILTFAGCTFPFLRPLIERFFPPLERMLPWLFFL